MVEGGLFPILKSFSFRIFIYINTYNFCREFGKFFGSYQKYEIAKKRTILTSNKNFMSSARSTLFYEISLYLDLPVSEVKAKYGIYVTICFHYAGRFIKNFVKNFAKSVGRTVLLHTRVDLF